MSSLVAKGPPARRLLCLACRQTKERTARTPWMAPVPSLASSCRRQYATIIRAQKRPPSKASKPPPSPPPPALPRSSQIDQDQLVFSQSDIPLVQEWTASLENFDNPEHLTALQCLDGAQRYVSVATPSESRWRGTLETKHGLSPSTLHWLGILLVSGNTPSRWRLGTHMLRSASELGYTPSTLSLVRTFRSMPAKAFEERVSQSKIYKDAERRFHEILEREPSPDALTLQGIVLEKEGDDQGALDMYAKAFMAWKAAEAGTGGEDRKSEPGLRGEPSLKDPVAGRGGNDGPDEFTLPPPRKPRWEWEVGSVIGQARIFRRQGRKEKAEQMYRVAALELDNPGAFMDLAELMDGPRDSPKRKKYLLKAAISGMTDAMTEIGELEKLAAQKEGLSKWQIAEHEFMGDQWLRLANGEELADIIDDSLGDDAA